MGIDKIGWTKESMIINEGESSRPYVGSKVWCSSTAVKVFRRQPSTAALADAERETAGAYYAQGRRPQKCLPWYVYMYCCYVMGALTSIKSGAHPSVKQPLESSSTPDDRVSYLLAVTDTLPANSAVI